MPVALNDVIKAVWQVKHTDPNTIAQNVYYWRVDDLVDGTFADVASEIQTQLIAMYTPLQGLFSVRYVLQDIRVTDETQKLFLGDGDGAGFSGNEAVAEVLPAQDSILILARSRKLGHQGRKFLGPIPENVVVNGDVDPAVLPDFTTFGDTWDSQFVGAVTTNTYQPGTVKFAAGGGVQSFEPFDTNLPKALATIRTQRRRRPTVGLS